MYEIYEKLRDERGVTDYRVATDLGLSRSTLSEWKSQKHKPNLDTLLKLASYFSVSVEYLIGK